MVSSGPKVWGDTPFEQAARNVFTCGCAQVDVDPPVGRRLATGGLCLARRAGRARVEGGAPVPAGGRDPRQLLLALRTHGRLPRRAGQIVERVLGKGSAVSDRTRRVAATRTVV